MQGARPLHQGTIANRNSAQDHTVVSTIFFPNLSRITKQNIDFFLKEWIKQHLETLKKNKYSFYNYCN